MNNLKKGFYWFLVLAVAISFSFASVKAEDKASSETTKQEVKSENVKNYRNLFTAGDSVSLKDIVVSKDLFVAGQSIDVNCTVAHNIFAAGNDVSVKGNIGGNIFAAGNTVRISGKIDGDLFLAGAKVVFDDEAELTGDIYAAGGDIKINGIVNGNVNAGSATISIGGKISGKTTVNAGTSVTIEKSAVIENLVYTSPKEATIDPGAKINKQEFTPLKETTQTRGKRPVFTSVVSFLSSLALAFLLVYLFKKPTKAVLEESFKNVASSLGIGFAILIAAPIALLIVAVTMIGGKIALLFGLVYLLFLLLGSSFAGIFLGSWVVKQLKKEHEIPMDWITILIGVSLLTLLNWIPFIGWFVKFALMVVGIGSLCKIFVQLIHHQ